MSRASTGGLEAGLFEEKEVPTVIGRSLRSEKHQRFDKNSEESKASLASSNIRESSELEYQGVLDEQSAHLDVGSGLLMES